MKILLLCEPRSGSTNLANWFYLHKKITVLFEPISNTKNPLKEFSFQTEHLLVKETFNNYDRFDNLINDYDKLICLYREDFKNQFESWINAKKTDNWDGQYIFNSQYDLNEETFFKNLKQSFKEKFIDKKYFSISYEDLYYENGIEKIIEYLGLDFLKIENWPVGFKYRINKKQKTLL